LRELASILAFVAAPEQRLLHEIGGADRVTGWTDEVRRQIGRGFDAMGLGPREMPSRIAAEFPGARLRAYQEERVTGPSVLIVPAPFKRAYIWDLLPDVSVVGHCRARGLRVYLLEWLVPGEAESAYGLADYADRLPRAAIDVVMAEAESPPPILAGHSIGGTFAAIAASLHPDRVSGLILVDAPLAFGEHGGPISRAVATIPHVRAIVGMSGNPVPGSVINALSVSAVPEAFQFQRLTDFAASLLSPKALPIHIRVERWAYDEFPLPGRLFEETLEQLYREDRFVQGTLEVGPKRTGVAGLRQPVMAVVNPLGRVVPPRSLLAGLEAVPDLAYEVLEYPGDTGPMLQHVGPLVAPVAHERLWPKILNWAVDVGRR
jgi:polyhydroxyalkanoate synthase